MSRIWPVKYRSKILVYFTALALLSGCITTIDKAPGGEVSSEEPTMSPIPASASKEETITLTEFPSAIGNIVFPTATPSPKANITATIDSGKFLYWGTVDYEQKTPIAFSMPTVSGNEYIYKNALASYNFGIVPTGNFYLNLDDLNDNGLTNSDIEIRASTGSGGTSYYLNPLNHAQYYYADKKMDLEMCMAEYPLTGFDELSYIVQAKGINWGGDFCILTNEGHMAVVHSVMDTLYRQNFTIVITVYKQVLETIYIPVATFTPGPTPTYNKYPGFSSEQSETVDKSVQLFIENVKKNDKGAIAAKLSFPLKVRPPTETTSQYLNSKSEFYYFYEILFTEEFRKEISEAGIQDVSTNGITFRLSVKHGFVGFDVFGNIREISNQEN